MLHFDVDVIADFQATNYPGSAGLSLDDVRAALEVFARQKHLAAIEVTAYNPSKDSDGSGAKLILDLLADILKARLAALQGETLRATGSSRDSAGAADASADILRKVRPNRCRHLRRTRARSPGEAWSSESLDRRIATTRIGG